MLKLTSSGLWIRRDIVPIGIRFIAVCAIEEKEEIDMGIQWRHRRGKRAIPLLERGNYLFASFQGGVWWMFNEENIPPIGEIWHCGYKELEDMLVVCPMRVESTN